MSAQKQTYCEHCGAVLPADAQFCSACGNELESKLTARKNKRGRPGEETASAKPADAQPGGYFPKASIQKRSLAYIVDFLVASLPPFMIALVFFVNMMMMGYEGTIPGLMLPLEVFLGLIALGVIWLLYYSLCRDAFRSGRSIGKSLYGLRVVQISNQQPCSWSKSIIRNLVGLINLILIFFIPVEGIVAALDVHGRRIGDRWAGTQVVEKKDFPFE